MLRRLMAVLFVLVGLLIAFVVAGFLVIPGHVTGKSLLSSVSRASGSAGTGGTALPRHCVRAVAKGHWRCEVSDRGGTGSALYDVKVGGLSCWKGRLLQSHGEAMPNSIRGCVILLRD